MAGVQSIISVNINKQTHLHNLLWIHSFRTSEKWIIRQQIIRFG